MDARDEVKSRLSIEDVIGKYLELKKSGRNFKALSPFTKEKTASFIVSPEKQIWHDFSSGKGGDVFSFVMDVEGMEFREALELLARQAGVDLEQYERPGRNSINKSLLYEINELAVKFYQVQFKANKVAYDYILKERQFAKNTVLEWQIGYAPNSPDALYSFLKSKHYSDKEIQTAGLITIRSSRPADMFRGRLMIPLADSQGRIVGFTARQVGSNNFGPKYINTPQTPLYDKSRHIYGLHQAKEAIRENGYVVIVEGNFDVIASHQAGVKQVVATAGTALTSQQLKSLGLLTKDVRLCFDADRAGLSATERAIPLASEQGLNISVVTMKDAKDPDELIKANKESWLATIEKPIYAVDWLINYHRGQLDLDSAPGKRRFSDLVLPIIRSLSDEVERDHYINQLAKILSVSPDSLNSKLSNIKPPALKAKLPINLKPVEVDKNIIERQKVENNFLSLMLLQKKLRDQMSLLSDEMFQNDDAIRLFNLLSERPNIDVKRDIAVFKEITDYVKIEVLLYEELYSGLDTTELAYEAARLKARLIENYIKNQKTEITRKLKTANNLDTRKLLEQARKLDNLLNHIKDEGGL